MKREVSCVSGISSTLLLSGTVSVLSGSGGPFSYKAVRRCQGVTRCGGSRHKIDMLLQVCRTCKGPTKSHFKASAGLRAESGNDNWLAED